MSDRDGKAREAVKTKNSERPYTEITSVIYMGPWSLKERIAAAAAIGVISFGVFFGIWLYAGTGGGGGREFWPSLLWPLGAAAVMTLIALVHPGWAEYLFEKIVSYRE